MESGKTRQQVREKTTPEVIWIDDIPYPVSSSPNNESLTSWNEAEWKKIERRVYRLQKRIYRASSQGKVKVVRRLQKILLSSWSAKMLAVRRVTQDNQGKCTAGVDGVKSLTPKQRIELVGRLQLTGKAKPTRRVWIPKPGKNEKRPLGIPTIHDRALQALGKILLEPEWEAKFEPSSYGFRPGRSCHDAIEAIFSAIRLKPKYVLDADIAKCFDRIDHSRLLVKVNTFPALTRQIRAWLKSGVLDNNEWFPTDMGTPQGGIISPLLANIALHGLEELVKDYVEKTIPEKGIGKVSRRRAVNIIRYADDFVILHKNQRVIEGCQQVVQEWLDNMGLELKPSKTRLAHTLNQLEDEKPGFDFLGFNIRQFKVGKHHSGRNREQILGFKTIIKPSKEKVKLHLNRLAQVIKKHKAVSQTALIDHLNPIIRGWCNYYSTAVSQKTFSQCDNLLYGKLRHWANRRHPSKSEKWCAHNYWHTFGKNNWVFSTKEIDKSFRLIKHASTPIVRHIKVKGKASPFDGNLTYWSSRMGKHPEMPKQVAILLKRQKGKCAYCGHKFREEDVMERDHKIPTSQGGGFGLNNLQLLHRHCHDQKTAVERQSEVRMTSAS
ncbi:MAG: group II intron reverse transcriptase/maturase [Cyanobacteria bacterium P01_E01_bin.42]